MKITLEISPDTPVMVVQEIKVLLKIDLVQGADGTIRSVEARQPEPRQPCSGHCQRSNQAEAS